MPQLRICYEILLSEQLHIRPQQSSLVACPSRAQPTLGATKDSVAPHEHSSCHIDMKDASHPNQKFIEGATQQRRL